LDPGSIPGASTKDIADLRLLIADLTKPETHRTNRQLAIGNWQ